MDARATMIVTVNDQATPGHNDYISEYNLSGEARQVMKAILTRMATNFAMTGKLCEIEDFARYMSFEVIRKQEPSWATQAEEDAKNLIIEYFMDEVIDQLISTGEASDDMYNDYSNGDATFGDTIQDRDYRRDEAIEILEDLYEHEEEDGGLWEGQDWESVLSIKAAYTYGNAVYNEFKSLISEINDIDVDQLRIETARTIANDHRIHPQSDADDDEFIQYIEESKYADQYEEELKIAVQEEIEEFLG